MWKILNLILFMTISMTSASAQSAKSLFECVKIAWENNISVKQTALGVAYGNLDLKQAQAARYPNLSAGSSVNISGRSVDPTNNQFASNSFLTNNYNISSNMSLYTGGQIRNNITRAKLFKESSNLQVEDIKQNITLQVSQAYLNVLFSDENLKIAEKRKNISQQQLNQLQKLIDAGIRAKNDIYELEATLAANDQSLISAQGNLDLARLQLNQVMQIPVDEKFNLVIPDIFVSNLDDPFALDVENTYQTAAKRQAALKNSALLIDIAEIDIDIAEGAFKPTIGIGGSVGTNYSSLGKQLASINSVNVEQDIIINDLETTILIPTDVPTLEDKSYINQVSDNVTYGYGLSLSVPIYSNYRNKANLHRAELGKINAQLVDQQNRDQFRQQIEQAVIDARNAKKQYDAAEKSVEASEKSLQNLQKGFAAGNVNNYELNIATSQYDNAVIQSLISKYDYIFKMKVLDFYLGKELNF